MEWNITGCVRVRDTGYGMVSLTYASGTWVCLCRTILSSAGNDGRVRLWKMTAGNVWRPAGHISVEQAEEQQGEVDADMAVEDP